MDDYHTQSKKQLEIIINEENLINMSKILNISEINDKFYMQNILSPTNSLSSYQDIIKKESDSIILNSNFKQDFDENKFIFTIDKSKIKNLKKVKLIISLIFHMKIKKIVKLIMQF